MRGSEFIFNTVDSLYYNFNKICSSKGGSYIDSPKWLKIEKETIYPKNNDDKCFQYALTVALNYQNIKNSPEKISKIKLFVGQYKWKEIFHHVVKIGKNLNHILYVPHNTKKIRHAYKSKHNLKLENQVILLMIICLYRTEL